MAQIEHVSALVGHFSMKQIFAENFYIHVSVRNLFITLIGRSAYSA